MSLKSTKEKELGRESSSQEKPLTDKIKKRGVLLFFLILVFFTGFYCLKKYGERTTTSKLGESFSKNSSEITRNYELKAASLSGLSLETNRTSVELP